MAQDRKDEAGAKLLAQLETERGLLEAVLKQMPAGVVIAEAPTGKIVLGNSQVEEILRHSFTPVDGVEQYGEPYACFDSSGRRYEPERMPLARSLMAGEVISGEEIHFERGDGSTGYVLLSSTPVRDREGRIVAAVAVFHDITGPKKAAEELKRSQERYRELFENANDIVYTLDLEGNLTSLNKSGERVTGYAREEMLGNSIARIVAPEYLQTMGQMMARKIEGEEITTYEVEVLAKDGRRLALEVSSRLIYEQGRALGIQGIARDITERKRAEEALRQSEERFSKAFSASPHLMTISTMSEGRYLDVNDAVVQATGYTREEIIGRTASELNMYFEPDGRERLLQAFKDGGAVRELEVRFRAKDGRLMTVLLSAEIIELGGERCILTTSNDITERKRAEEALRQSEERFSKAFHASPHPMSISTLDGGRYIDVNDSLLRITGYAREEIIGRTASELGVYADPADRERLLKVLRRMGHVRDLEIKFRTRSGAMRIFSMSAEVVTLNGEQCLLTASNDVTERKRIEAERAELLAREQEARRQAEAANRMKDEFLATVSHELRTPLNAILGWAEMLRGNKFDQEVESRALDTIVRNARSQAQLIEDILDVSRIITGKLRLDTHPVEIVPVINAAIDAVRPAVIAKEIQLDVRLDQLVAPITGDAGRLQQVVWNLLANAIKFTPARGRVALRLEQAGASARIAVTDTGIGISQEFLPHVFDRFRQADSSYTRRHGGLGLGLAIVRHLVEMHGGTVDAESAGEGLGATFTVNLPLLKGEGYQGRGALSPALMTDELSAVSNLISGGGGLHPSGPTAPPLLDGVRALVVDDEADARELITTALEQHGAKVVATPSAAEAILALSRSAPGEQFDVVLSDIGMPGEDGLSLVSRMRSLEECEKLPAIALTAYARDEDRARALMAGFDLHISKPFTPSELAEAVADLARRVKQDAGG